MIVLQSLWSLFIYTVVNVKNADTTTQQDLKKNSSMHQKKCKMFSKHQQMCNRHSKIKYKMASKCKGKYNKIGKDYHGAKFLLV